jgi:hypothetical protein
LRSHVIADLSVNYVERLFLRAGHVTQSIWRDYGYDLTVTTHDRRGYAQAGLMYLQLKATERLQRVKHRPGFTFPIARQHFNLWSREALPVFVILYSAHADQAYWLHVQPCFAANPDLFKPGQKTAKIFVPARSVLDDAAVEYMARIKQEAYDDARQKAQQRH